MSNLIMGDLAQAERFGQKFIGGYRNYFESLPKMDHTDYLFDIKQDFTRKVMDHWSDSLRIAEWVTKTFPVKYDATVVGLTSGSAPKVMVERSSTGYTAPIHSHFLSFLYESLLFGKVRYHTYQLINDKIVPERTVVKQQEALFCGWVDAPIIHNFTSLGNSAILSLAEHWKVEPIHVEHFEVDSHDVEKIGIDKMKFAKVVLIRDDAQQDLGDHFLIVGDRTIQAPTEQSKKLLNLYRRKSEKVTRLRLHEFAAKEFLKFHNYGN